MDIGYTGEFLYAIKRHGDPLSKINALIPKLAPAKKTANHTRPEPVVKKPVPEQAPAPAKKAKIEVKAK